MSYYWPCSDWSGKTLGVISHHWLEKITSQMSSWECSDCQGSVIDIKSGVRLRTTLWPEPDLSPAIKVPSNKVLARPNKSIKYKAKFPNLSLIYERSVYLEQHLEVLQKQITRSFYQYSKLLNAQFFLGAYIWIYRTNDYNIIQLECQERWNK